MPTSPSPAPTLQLPFSMVTGSSTARMSPRSSTATGAFPGASSTTAPSPALRLSAGSIEQSKQDHAADIFEAIGAGALYWERVCEIGEIVVGENTGRPNNDQITVYKNNGLAIEFVALAWKIFTLARERGAGEEIPARFFRGEEAITANKK